MSEKSWEWEEVPEENLVRLSGEVNFTSTTKVRAKFNEYLQRSDGALRLDLGGLSYMDSSGLAVFIELKKKLRSQGRELEIVDLHPNAEKVFRLTQVAEMFGI
jgi:anti-sigma B factor antagonist